MAFEISDLGKQKLQISHCTVADWSLDCSEHKQVAVVSLPPQAWLRGLFWTGKQGRDRQ